MALTQHEAEQISKSQELFSKAMSGDDKAFRQLDCLAGGQTYAAEFNALKPPGCGFSSDTARRYAHDLVTTLIGMRQAAMQMPVAEPPVDGGALPYNGATTQSGSSAPIPTIPAAAPPTGTVVDTSSSPGGVAQPANSPEPVVAADPVVSPARGGVTLPSSLGGIPLPLIIGAGALVLILILRRR